MQHGSKVRLAALINTWCALPKRFLVIGLLSAVTSASVFALEAHGSSCAAARAIDCWSLEAVKEICRPSLASKTSAGPPEEEEETEEDDVHFLRLPGTPATGAACANPLDLDLAPREIERFSRVAVEIDAGRPEIFTFMLTFGAAVAFESEGDSELHGRLLDGCGRLLATGATTNDGRNFQIVEELPAGRYYLEVEGSGVSRGAYVLHVATMR